MQYIITLLDVQIYLNVAIDDRRYLHNKVCHRFDNVHCSHVTCCRHICILIFGMFGLLFWKQQTLHTNVVKTTLT